MNEIEKIIHQYGREILESEEFAIAWSQKHHFCTTVAFHSLSVTVLALLIAKLFIKLKIEINTRELVIACLAHDLGILGRYDGKFKSGKECCKMHPVYSADIANKFSKSKGDKIADAIKCHMFPLFTKPPKYIEGKILCIADKISPILEVTGYSPANSLLSDTLG